MAYIGVGINKDILSNDSFSSFLQKNSPSIFSNSSTGSVSVPPTSNEVIYVHAAAGTSTYTLPSASTGRTLYFLHNGTTPSSPALNQLKIQPASGDQIVFQNNKTINPGTLNINLRGVYLKLTSVDSTTWQATNLNFAEVIKNKNVVDSQKSIEITGRDTWVSKTSMTNTRNSLAGFSLNGYGYACNGVGLVTVTNEVQQYSDTANSWTTKATGGTARRRLSGFSINGFGYIAGGETANGATRTAEVNKYNDSANTWSTVTSLGTATEKGSAFSLNGYGYYAGGFIGSDTATSFRYNDNLNSWASIASMPTALQFMASASSNGYSYLFCGSGSVDVNQTVEYNDSANTYTTRANAGTVRFGSTGFSNNSYLYNVGGIASGTTDEVNQFNFILNVWINKTVYPMVVFTAEAFSLNGSGYVCGGLDTIPFSSVYEYN